MSFTSLEIELYLLGLACAGYAVAWWNYWRALRTAQETASRRARLLAAIAFFIHVGSLTLRTYRAGHLPIYNAYEFSTLFAGGIVLVQLIFERLSPREALGLTTLPVALALLFYAWTLPKAVEPIFPIFRSFWLKVHILTAIVAYSSLAITFGASCLYLVTRRPRAGNAGENSSSRLKVLDSVAYQAAALGFPFLTVCVISGAIWAEYVWGRFWSWDPKETWSLITWFIVAAYLHTRYHRGWKEHRAAILGIVGFVLVLMTFLGVELLNPGQHDFLLWKKG
jgi:cytochrome c-type biogenesis protein CcsB